MDEFTSSDRVEKNAYFVAEESTIDDRTLFSNNNYFEKGEFERPYVHWSKNRIRLREDIPDSIDYKEVASALPSERYNLNVKLYLDVNTFNDSTHVLTSTIFDPYDTFYHYPNSNAGMASQMLQSLERDDKHNLKLDVLTYALVYSALHEYGDTESSIVAANVLEKAQRQAKKLAGSSRRKALAAARRKPVRNAVDSQDVLQSLLGAPDFAILAETEDYIVVNKPAGTVCHHNHMTTAGKIGKKNADVSLVDALLHVNVPLSTINPQAQGLVHRLDRGMCRVGWLVGWMDR